MLQVGNDAMLEVMQGEVLPMNCDLRNPGESTTITWLFNNSTNLPTNVSIQSDGTWLHIVDAQIANHQGTYTCLVENSVGKARREFNVNILEPPRFIDTSNTKYLLLQGQTIMLDCTLKGAPWPKIVWKKFQNDSEKMVVDEVIRTANINIENTIIASREVDTRVWFLPPGEASFEHIP
uniref:Ig-like domain-containing protein n=1 Tax=Meloidogyne floridensis TaxID=298350 RepID=A0A915P8V9_9BILA